MKIINLQEDVSSVESSIEDLSDKLDTSQDEIPPPPPPVDTEENSVQTNEQVQELETKIGSMAEELASIKSTCSQLESKLSGQTVTAQEPVEIKDQETNLEEDNQNEEDDENYVDIYETSSNDSEIDPDSDIAETQTDHNQSIPNTVNEEDIENEQEEASNKDKIIIIDNESKTLEEWLFLYKVSSDDQLRGLIYSNPEIQAHLN